MQEILTDFERALFESSRAALGALVADLADEREGSPESFAALRDALEMLEEPFLLVVVGEFNAGKSSLINALLGEEVLAEGVTPTTARIHWIRAEGRESGTQMGPERVDAHGVVHLAAAAPVLEDLSLVDTPGTNAIDRSHEALTERFVPRADTIVFVTSADRPFTESERTFLERLGRWSKKVLVAVNKADLMETIEDRRAVEKFVTEAATRLLRETPPIFMVSARRQRRDTGGDAGFADFENYLAETLDARERVVRKLEGPLQVADQLLKEQRQEVSAQRELLADDLETLDRIERQTAAYSEDMAREFTYRLGDLEGVVAQVETRGTEFFDRTLRLRNVGELLRRKSVEERFERDVVGDLAARVDQRVRDLIDWMISSEHRQWRDLEEHIHERLAQHRDRVVGSRAVPSLESRRDQLLERLGEAARGEVERFDRDTEASRIAESARNTVAGTAVLEAGALGLGGIFALAAMTTAADFTGVIAAGTVAALGLVVLPARRRKAQGDLRASLQSLRVRLVGALRGEFESELRAMERRLTEVTGPYTRFVRSELDRLREREQQVGGHAAAVTDVLLQVERLRQG